MQNLILSPVDNHRPLAHIEVYLRQFCEIRQYNSLYSIPGNCLLLRHDNLNQRTTATLLWLLFDNTPHWIVNFGLVFLVLEGWLCLISGIVPLSVLLLCTFAIDTFSYGPDIGFVFFLETIMIAAFYVLYMIQCIRRCHDLGRKWWFCLIPFYNPFVLLFGKTKGKQNNANDIG